MHAIVHDSYGSADVLELRDVDVPVPSDNQVLVRVHAASFNASDWYMMAGLPYLVRMAFGVPRPKVRIRGHDIAGRVEAVGAAVTKFTPGDLVFGACHGGFAEYAAVSEDRLAPRSATVSCEQAAGVPVAGLTALQALRDHAGVEAGHRVLVVGAAGGVGTFSVQLAAYRGAVVTGVCSTRNIDTVRSIDASRVIDYTRDDYTATDERYDAIIDIRGDRPLRRLLRLLVPDGTYVLAGAPRGGRWLGPLVPTLKRAVAAPFLGRRTRNFVANVNADDLRELGRLLESGAIRSVIDKTFPLCDVPAAVRYWEAGHVRGKVAIAV